MTRWGVCTAMENNGLIEQSIELEGQLSMEQKNAMGSIQAANLVGSGDELVNNGQIRQSVKASSAVISQKNAAFSTQAINAVTAGNPAASGAGF